MLLARHQLFDKCCHIQVGRVFGVCSLWLLLLLFVGYNIRIAASTGTLSGPRVEAVFFNASQLALSDYEDRLLLYTLQVSEGTL